MVIFVLQNGVPRGYIRSVNFARCRFTVTKIRSKARVFDSARVKGVIDSLVAMSYGKGYLFSCSWK